MDIASPSYGACTPHERSGSDDALSVLQPIPVDPGSWLRHLAFGLRPHLSAVAQRGPPLGRLQHQKPSRPSCLGSRCQFLAILTRRSRYTLVPSSFSICVRAAVPTSRSLAPPLPMTMPFWLSRST